MIEFYLPIVLIVLLYLIRVREFTIKRATVPGPIKEKLSFYLLFLGGTLVIACSLLEYILLDRPSLYLWMLVGTIITVSAFLLRNWAIKTLGKFWSVHVEIRDNHELIEAGPFKRVRHPVYTAAALELIGIVIIGQAYLTSFIILLLVIPSILFRIHIEEKELIHKFGSKYEEYIKRTGALFPKLS